MLMLGIEDKLALLTESEKRDLMISIEELAQIEGLRDYSPPNSEIDNYSELKILIDNKAEKTDIIRHDGSVELTNDWNIGDGRKIIAEQIRARDSDGLSLFEDGGVGIFVKDGGNVGIGTTSPSDILHLVKNQNNQTRFRIENTNVSSSARAMVRYYGATSVSDTTPQSKGYFEHIGVGNTTTIDGVALANSMNFAGACSKLIIWQDGNNPIHFFTNNLNRMIILGTGNVGVGTLTPSAKLAINGGLHVGGDSDPGDNNILVDGRIEIDGDIDHDGSNIGFFGTTPVGKQTSLTSQLTTITHTSPSSPDYAIADPINSNAYGFTTSDEFKTAMSVIANLQIRVSELETKLRNYGLLQ